MSAVAGYNANNCAINFMYVDSNETDFNVQLFANEFFLNIKIIDSTHEVNRTSADLLRMSSKKSETEYNT